MMLLVQVLLRLRGTLATQPLAPLGEGMTVILLKKILQLYLCREIQFSFQYSSVLFI